MQGIVKCFRQFFFLPSSKPLYKNYIDIAFPAAIEGLLIMLISSVDLIMVGSLGADAVAAVGIISQPRMMILCVCRSLGVAVTAIVARRKGEGKTHQMSACMKQSFLITLGLSSVILLLSLRYIGTIVTLAGANSSYHHLATHYGSFIMVGIFFTSLAVILNAAQTGQGNTKTIMIANVAGNIVNTFLNALLIHGIGLFPELGVTGAAIATLIGNFTTFLISLAAVLSPKKELSLWGKAGWAFEKEILDSLRKVGFSAFFEQFFERVGMFLYTRMVAELGTLAFATHHICMNACDIFYSFGQGMSKASSALCGQKLGQKRKDLAFLYGKIGQRIGLITSFVAFGSYLLFRDPLMRLYTQDPKVIALGANILIIIAIVSIFQTQALVYVGVLRGAGDTKFIATYSFWDIAVFRPILTWVLCFPLGLGLYGAWLALFADQALRMLFSTWRFYSQKWTHIEL